MHELFLVSYLGGAISTARKPPTLYRAINRRETERKRGGSDVDAHAIPRRSPALCSQYRARPAKIGLWGTIQQRSRAIRLGETREVFAWIGSGMWAALCSCFRLSVTFPWQVFFLSKIITDFCNAFRKSVLTTNPRGANSFNYIRSLIVPSYREQTSVRKTIRQRTRIISEESKQRVELKHASPPRGVNLVVPGPSFTTKETRSCMTTRLHCSTVS